ncbi:hypothetical protein ACFWQC_23005 [Nocardioides sp. NPDC058538]|uniref:hypothetical protein n=1 Tax=Nocardioides sp. NPDC058538 TaxID=3346542 RepID=UPI003650FCEA
MINWNWPKIIGWGLFATVVIWFVALAPTLLVVALLPDSKLPVYGSAGGMFGASSALFSGLGFFGLVLVLYSDLKERRRDLSHREDDLKERKQSRTPFLVPSVAEKGSRIVRANKVDGRHMETSLTLDLLVQNVTDEPAMNITLTSMIAGDGMPGAHAVIDDTPFGTGDAAKKKANLHFSASGAAAEKLLQHLADGVATTVVIGLEYASINGTRWTSEVKYELKSQAAERILFQGIIDGNAEAFVEERPGFSGGDDIFLAFSVVPGSWTHRPMA